MHSLEPIIPIRPNPHARAYTAGGEPECFLAFDPREGSLALETLVATYVNTLDGSYSGGDTASGLPPNGNGNGNSTAGSGAPTNVAGSPQLFNRREQEQGASGAPSGPLPILQPASDDERERGGRSSGEALAPGGALPATGAGAEHGQDEIPAMSEHHATEVFRVCVFVCSRTTRKKMITCTRGGNGV